MRPKPDMLADSTTIRKLYRRPSGLTDEQMTAVRVAMDVVDLLKEIELKNQMVYLFKFNRDVEAERMEAKDEEIERLKAAAEAFSRKVAGLPE